MKPLLILPTLLLASCAAPSGPSGGSTASSTAREDMQRKLIGFQQKFDRFDYNGDGYVSRPELTTGINTENVDDINASQVPKIFKLYDRNGDNRISLAEVNAAAAAGPDAALRIQNAP